MQVVYLVKLTFGHNITSMFIHCRTIFVDYDNYTMN